MYKKDLLKGTLKTLLLSLLDEKGEMYGYEISQTVKLRTNEEITITEGAMYPALHKLEANGLVESYSKSFEGRNRKYYSLTPKGKREAKRAKQDWVEFSELVRIVLNQITYA